MSSDSTKGPPANPFRLLSAASFHASASELYRATKAVLSLVASDAFCAACVCDDEATEIESECPVGRLQGILERGQRFDPDA